jgi:hypothetical protein
MKFKKIMFAIGVGVLSLGLHSAPLVEAEDSADPMKMYQTYPRDHVINLNPGELPVMPPAPPAPTRPCRCHLTLNYYNSVGVIAGAVNQDVTEYIDATSSCESLNYIRHITLNRQYLPIMEFSCQADD